MTAAQELHRDDPQFESTQYAVGISDVEDEHAPIDRVASRVLEAGFEVLIPAPLRDQVPQRLHDSIRFVDTDATDGRAREADLIDAAKTEDLKGIVLWEPGDEIDLSTAVRTLNVSDPYAIPSSAVGVSEEPGRLVGIPAYNESVGIGSVVISAQQYADEVVVVDDGSSDDTVDIALKTDATVLEHGTNQGKGRAIQTFFTYARESDHESFVILDGDGQHLPADIPDVAGPVENGDEDLVIGSRYLEDETGEETPFHRRVGQQVLDYLTLGSSGAKHSDTQSGFRAFSPNAVDRLSIRTDGMGVESEMIAIAQDHELAIEEVPIDVRYEGIDGQTFNPVHHGLTVATFVLQQVRDRHPLIFFGLPGLVFLVLGGGVALHSAIIYQSTSTFHQWRMTISGFTIIVGILCVFSGLVLNQVSNIIAQNINENNDY